MGIFVYSQAGPLENKPKVRTGECAALVQEYTHAPHTTLWRPGVRVLESNVPGQKLESGTAIATFVNGRYPFHEGQHRHAAFFLRYGAPDRDGLPSGFWVVEQWNHPPLDHIQARFLKRRGKIQANGEYPNASNNAEAFYVIQSP